MREGLGTERQGAVSTIPRLRAAFYALAPGGWRDYYSLLHPPYTAWHLSYVVLGFALAPTVRYGRLAPALGAFFLALGIAAHALDELAGRPLGTRIPTATLKAMAVVSLAGAVGLGLAGAVFASIWLLLFIPFGLFIALAYNLEWFGGRFHTDGWFALAWGSFPFLTGYWISGEQLAVTAILGAAAAYALSLAQRTLSNRVRTIRRRVRQISGTVTYRDGSAEAIGRRWTLEPEERALQLLTVTIVLISVAALVARL